MKRLLFCVGILALAASCAEDMDTMSVQQTNEKGIVFTTGDDAVITRGEYQEEIEGETPKYYPFWTAEKDYISVFSTKTSTSLGANSWNDLTGFNAGKVTYKATRSERNAYFTGLQPDNVLDFDAAATQDEPAKFIALYPQTATGAESYIVSGGTETVVFSLPEIPAVQTQNNLAGNGVYEKIAKYSVTNGYAAEDNKAAVGENVQMNFVRVNPAVVYQTEGLNAYKTEFGKLQTIELESNGQVKADGTLDNTQKSNLATGATDVDLKLTLKSTNKGVFTDIKHELSGNASVAGRMTLKLGSAGLDWSDEARAYMAIANVNRVGADNKAFTEEMAVTYTFDNIKIKETIRTSASWMAPDFYNCQSLDVDSYPYLVFNNTKDYDGVAQNGEYTVLINKGTVAQIFDNNGKVKLLDGTVISATDVKKFIAKTDMSDADFASMVKLTALEQVNLVNETSIPANAFKGLNGIVKLEMPKVISIDKGFLGTGNLSSVKYLNLASYKFDGNGDNETAKAVNQNIFNTGLEYVDMSALEDMTPVFGLPEAQISFQNYTALQSVKVNNLKLRASSFEKCTALEKIDGSVDVSEGYAAFKECDNAKFNTINLVSDEIAEDAFKGCTNMKNVLKGGVQVAPTKIGNRAFMGVKGLVYMDLSKATEIGTSAFDGAANFEATSATNDIVTVIAPSISARAFAGTNIAKIEFTEATTLGSSFLAGNNAVVHIKFVKPFTVNFTPNSNLFGPNDCSKITLFYAEGQKGLSGRTLTLNGTQFTFKDVVKN